jgi:hypothetical protein
MNQLHALLETMSVPTGRYDDTNWLLKNLHVLNSDHVNYRQTMRMLMANQTTTQEQLLEVAETLLTQAKNLLEENGRAQCKRLKLDPNLWQVETLNLATMLPVMRIIDQLTLAVMRLTPKPDWVITEWGTVKLFKATGYRDLGWHCPKYPGKQAPVCSYEQHGYNRCDYCGEPEERK